MIISASVIVLLCTPTVSAESAALTDKQIELIRQNCVAAQSDMQRLEQSEAVVRRNRGVTYESTLRLMAALNSRIALNKLTAPSLNSLTAEVERKRAEFVENYIAYNNSYHTTMKLTNCTNQPLAFYDYLSQTRELRVKLATTIEDIDRLLDAYQTNLNDLKRNVSGDTQ